MKNNKLIIVEDNISTEISLQTIKIIRDFLQKRLSYTKATDIEKNATEIMFAKYLNIKYKEYSIITSAALFSMLISFPANKIQTINDLTKDRVGIEKLSSDITEIRKMVLEKYKNEYPEIIKKYSKKLENID